MRVATFNRCSGQLSTRPPVEDLLRAPKNRRRVRSNDQCGYLQTGLTAFFCNRMM